IGRANGGNERQRQQGGESECFHGVLLARIMREPALGAELRPSRRLLTSANPFHFPEVSCVPTFFPRFRSRWPCSSPPVPASGRVGGRCHRAACPAWRAASRARPRTRLATSTTTV